MIAKGLINTMIQSSLRFRASFNYHPLLMKRSFNYQPVFTPSVKLAVQCSLSKGSQFAFSSFKDEYNEPADDKSGILKQFEELIERFQSSYDSAKYQQARQHLEKSAELMRKVNCQNSIQYVQILLNIVATVKKYGNTQRIVTALQEAESILNQLPEANYSHKQIIYSHLSYEYDVKKDHSKTIDYLKKLLDLFQKTEIESLEVIQINEKIGELYLQLTKLEEAIPYFSKALELLQVKNTTNNKEYLKILDDLSYIFYNLEKFEQVLELRLKTLKIQETLSGKQSLPYISHLKNIGLIYKRLSNFEKYTQSMEEALRIAEKQDQARPIINEIKQNLGIYYFYNKHQFERALPLLESALSSLSIQRQQSKYLYFLRAIAECHKNLKDFELSKQRFEEVLSILDKKEEKGCEYAYILSEVGLAHYNLQRYEDSLKYYLKSLAIEEQKHGEESQTCIQLYQNVAQLYYLLGNTSQSQEYLKKIQQYKHLATKHH